MIGKKEIPTYHIVHCSEPKPSFNPAHTLHIRGGHVHESLNLDVSSLSVICVSSRVINRKVLKYKFFERRSA